MSLDKIRTALASLQEDPENQLAWTNIEDAVTGDAGADAVRELEMSRVWHERLRSWPVVARLLAYEVELDEPVIAGAKQLELARIYHEELLRDDMAASAYSRAKELKPDEPKISEALGEIEFGRANLEVTVEQALVESLDSDDDKVRVQMLLRAAEYSYRFGDGSDETMARVVDLVGQALDIDDCHQKALSFAAVVFQRLGEWARLADVLSKKATTAPVRADKIGAAYRLAVIARHKLEDQRKAVEAHQILLELDVANSYALQYLVEYYSENEEWDYLVALYEDQLSSGAVKPADEIGIWVQLAMLNWKTRGKPHQAEPYFEKVRRHDPTHTGVLKFFRERYAETEPARLMGILTDAQRALEDEGAQNKLAEEIAQLAEGQANARRAIEQYKTILRNDPDNGDARQKLRALYLETESYNAVVELLRQDLQRLPEEDAEARVALLKEIAAIYRDRMHSDNSLLTTLTQILQLDEEDIGAVRDLVKVYESLGRWRDLLNTQQQLAALTKDKAEKVRLLRAVARRWLDQFSNAQNAIGAYEQLLETTGDDLEARDKLRELYKKRRQWDKLYQLYRSQVDSVEGELRVELMLEMATLAAERLSKGAEAIALLKDVLAIDPNADSVLDKLERQAERQKDYPTVAYVLDRRIEQTDDDKTKLGLLQKLGVLYADKISDADHAQKTWRRVLDLSPGHKRALRVLRQSFVEVSDWDGLAALYGSQSDFEGLADFLSTTADRSKDDAERLALSFRAAAVYEDQLSAPERAARSYERVLSIDPKNVEAAQRLLPLYEDDEKWSRLPALHQVLLGATEDVDDKINILQKIAEITGGPLANKNAALGYAREAYQLRPDDVGLERLRDWSVQSGEWSAFIEVVDECLGDSETSPARRRQLKSMLATVYSSEVERIDDAVEIYRALLKEDPSDEEMAGNFERLLRAADRRDDLRWLFELRVSQTSGDTRFTALEEWATVEEEVFGESEKAVGLLLRVVSEGSDRPSALGALARLQLQAGDYMAASRTLAKHRDVAERDALVEIETKLARLNLEHLEDPAAAYEACVRALLIDEDSDAVVELLEELMTVEETRSRAAEALERIYGARGVASKQAGALHALLESVGSGERRMQLCLRLAGVYENELDNSVGAFEVILNTLVEVPGDLVLWDRAAELSVLAGRPTDLAQAYREHFGSDATDQDGDDGSAGAALDDELVLELSERAAILHEEQLGDPEGAVPYLQRMLTIKPTNEAAFGRLKDIFTTVERWSDLETLYKATIEATEAADAKVELMNQAALVAEDMIGSHEKAIEYYQRIMDIEPLHEGAGEALNRLLGREERFADLAGLLESRLETATDEETLAIQQRLVELYLRKLQEPSRALPHLDNLVRQSEDDLDVRALAEECLDVEELRQPVAALLDGLYEAIDDPRDLVRVLDVRLEGVETHEQRRELLHRIAALKDERLKDDVGAFEALSALMPLEPDDADIRARLLGIGRRLGENEKMTESLLATAERASSMVTRGEALMEAASLLRDKLDEVDRAAEVYGQILAIDPDDPDLVVPAATALSEIHQERGEHTKLAEVLAVQVRLVADVEEAREVYARIATLYEDLIDDEEKAIKAWQACLEADHHDQRALGALERLYEQTQQWTELVEVLRHLEEAAEDGDDRKRCMVKVAEVLADELGETSDAINAWRAVLDDFGPQSQTLSALSKLYRDAQRWEDLAEVFDVWLSLTDELDERVELFAGLGDLQREHLADPQGALAAYRQVLTLEPANERSRNALAEMLSHEDADIKREAAEIIGPLYEADGDATRLLKVLDIEIESTYDPVNKLEILERALRTAEDTVGSVGQAFDYACRGVREAIGEPTLSDWIGHVERLAHEAERYVDLLELFEGVVGELLDAEVQQSVRRRAGELAREQLQDKQRAIGHYHAALEATGDDQQSMVALEELYAETDNNTELLEILKLRGDAAETDSERVELFFRVAELQSGPLEQRDDAIATYEDLINLSLELRAVEALEGLYSDTERYEDLVSLYERQLDDTADESARADIRVKLARVSHEKLADTHRALDELGDALEDDRGHAGVIGLLEQILEQAEEPDQRGLVAELLEPVYLAAHNWQKLHSALEARLETTQDPSDRVELLTRLATLYEEQLENYGKALDTVAIRLREEPSDEEVWGEVERLGRVLGEGSEERVAEIFAAALEEVGADDPKTASLCARTGELFAIVGRNEEALPWYRRSYEFSPDSVEMFDAIDDLLTKLDRSEDRIQHFRAALDNTFDDEPRVRYLHTVAQLHRDLGQDEDAIGVLVEVLDIDEDNEPALDGLTALYQKGERVNDLADLYDRRAELAADPDAAAPHRLALAKLLATQPGDRDRAIDQLEEIVSDLPWHEGAIAELEAMLDDDELAQRIIDALRPLYERAENWRGLIKLNDRRLGLLHAPHDKVDVLMDTATMWEEQGEDAAKAFGVVRQAFDLAPENEDTRATLERLAAMVDGWTDLADSYVDAAASSADDFVKRQLFSALAVVCDEQLDDPRRALSALNELSSLDPSDVETLEQMDIICTLLADWNTLVVVLERQVDNAVDDDARSAVLRRLGELRHDMLDDADGAVRAYEQALELAPDSTASLDQLIGLYESRDAARLAELLEQRIQVTDHEEDEVDRYRLILRAADVYAERLEQPDESIRMLQLALDGRPTDLDVLTRLESLYREGEAHHELLENLKTQASIADDRDVRVGLRNKIGDLYLLKLDNAYDALEQYRLVLDESEDDAHAIDAARRIADDCEDLRADVAELLVPVLTGLARHRDLVEVMELRFSAQTDPSDRAQSLMGIALIQEEQLDTPEDSRDTLLRALAETPDDANLHHDINRLCGLTGDWAKYAEVLSVRADATYDAVAQADLYSRLGRICAEELDDKGRAIGAYEKAAEQAEDPSSLLESLDALYVATERWDDLGKVLERRIELEHGGDAQAELGYRLGKLQIGEFDQKELGLQTLRIAADSNAEHAGVREELERLTDVEALFEEVAEVLDTMYRVAEDSPARAKLRNKRISYAPTAEERVRLRLELAQMLEDESFDTSSAQDVLQQALFDDAGDSELLAQLERLATTNAAGAEGERAWGRAADAVGKAVHSALREEGAAAGNMSSELARDLLLRTADWYRERGGDVEGAERRLTEALELDGRYAPAMLSLEELHRAEGRESDLVGTLRKLADLAQAGEDVGREPAELRREAKILADTALEDAALAENILREMLEADDADVWALTELTAVCERNDNQQELYTLLLRRIELMPDADSLRALRHQAAAVAADKLDDPEAAIDLYEQAFEDEPEDEVASDALRNLYEKLERYEALLRFAERLLEMIEEPAERAALRMESARICVDILEAPTEGIEHLNAVLDELPTHEPAVVQLSKMLEKEQRYDELAELLNQQIELAREMGDGDKELGYRVKVAELFESRINDPDQAIDGYLGVLETDATFRPAIEALARLYEQEAQLASAAEMYERLLVGSEAADMTHMALKARDLFASVDDKEAAGRVLETVLDSGAELAESDVQQLRDGLREVYKECGAWEQLAALVRTEAEESDSSDEKVVLFTKAAEIHSQKREDHAAAAELLEKAVELRSEDRDLMLSLCDEYTKSGRGNDAIEVLQRVVESYGGRRSKDLADIHHRIASAYLAEGDHVAALKDLEAARKMDPGSVVVLHALGTLLLDMARAAEGDDKADYIARAGKGFRSLLLQRLDADSPVTKADVFYLLAMVSHIEGDAKKAIQMAERAVSNDKQHAKAQDLLAELKD